MAKIKLFIESVMERLRLRVLKISIKQCHKNSCNPEIIELRDNINRWGIRPFLGDFTQKYENFNVEVMREENNGCFYVMHNGEKLFFPKHSSEKGVSVGYMKLCREQDPGSPHRYVEDYNVMKDCYVIEAGAAEASFSLDALSNGCKKVYICECNQGWIEPLNKTFAQYGDRAEIIQKYISDVDTENTTTIDAIFRKAVEQDGFDFDKDKIFVKMDIEGMEEKGISGMAYMLKNAKNIELSICAYHNQDDEKMIRSYFPESEWEIETSPSYMLFHYDKKQKRPYFRRGVLRIRKRQNDKINSMIVGKIKIGNDVIIAPNTLCAPVIITTCNRYDHFRKCIESLQKNALAKETELFIGFDYPPSPEYESGYRKIEAYINQGIEGFKKVNILKREYNYGAAQNYLDLINLVMQKYDRWINTEDDNVFSGDFLDYMNYYLELYKNDEKVFAIGGHTGCKEELWLKGKGYIFAKHMYNAWGEGLWRYKWQKYMDIISKEWIESMIRKSGYINSLKMPRRIKRNLVRMFSQDNWAVGCDTIITFYLWFSRKYQVFPCSTKVKNNGFDGTGMHAINDKERNEGTFESGIVDIGLVKFSDKLCVLERDYYSMFYDWAFLMNNEIIYCAVCFLGFKRAKKLLGLLRIKFI